MAIGRDRFAQGIVVRLFRAWSVLVDEGRSPLPRLQDIVAPLGLPDETAVACASLFELVEGTWAAGSSANAAAANGFRETNARCSACSSLHRRSARFRARQRCRTAFRPQSSGPASRSGGPSA